MDELTPMTISAQNSHWLSQCTRILASAALLVTVGCSSGSDGESSEQGGGGGNDGLGTAANAPLTGSFDAWTHQPTALFRFDAATGITTLAILEEFELDEDRASTPQVSADGTRIYLVYENCEPSTECIVITDIDGRELERIFPVNGTGTPTQPVIVRDTRESPDGSLLLVRAGRARATGTELLVFDTAGNLLARHLDNDSLYGSARWLPDGRIVYLEFAPDQLRIIDDPLTSTDGTHRVLFEFRPDELHGSDNNPQGFFDELAVNPVSGDIAFIWNGIEQDNANTLDTFDHRVYVFNPDDGSLRELAQGTTPDGFNRGFRDLLYSPDGRWMSAVVTLGDPVLDRELLIALDSGVDQPIAIDNVTDSLPDGVIYLMTDCGGNVNQVLSTIISCGNRDIGLTGRISLIAWR